MIIYLRDLRVQINCSLSHNSTQSTQNYRCILSVRSVSSHRINTRHQSGTWLLHMRDEPQWETMYLRTCVPGEDSDQPAHPGSQIRVFVVRLCKPSSLGYLLGAQRRLRSACADAQADLSLHWAHMSESTISDAVSPFFIYFFISF